MSRTGRRHARAIYLGEKYSDEMDRVDRLLEKARNENKIAVDEEVPAEDAAKRRHVNTYTGYKGIYRRADEGLRKEDDTSGD